MRAPLDHLRAVGIAALFCLPVAAEAICLPTFIPAEVEESYRFARALGEALTWVKESAARAKADPQEELGEWLYQMRLSESDLRCAASLMKPFADSADVFIAVGATMAATTFSEMAQLEATFRTEVRQGLFQQERTVPNLAKLLDQLSERRVAKEKLWKMLPLVSATATHALVRYSETGGATGRLKLTGEERRDVMAELVKSFGPSIRGGASAGQSLTDGAAAVLYGFLADQQWRSSGD